MLRTLRAYQAMYERDPDGFRDDLQAPVIVLDAFKQMDDTGFQTLRGDALKGGTKTVARIEKREGTNPFSQMVTLGRARNNDIELKAASISKFHAYFTLDGNGDVFMTDAGSTYGTQVGGDPLIAKIPVRLTSGVRIDLGSLGAVFYQPADFVERLASHREETPQT